MCSAFLLAWFKLRPLLISRITSPVFEPFKLKTWRKILGLLNFGKTAGSCASKEYADVQEQLQRCIDLGQTGVRPLTVLFCYSLTQIQATVDLRNLQTAPVVWNGIEYPSSSPPPPNICRLALWEMFEINFRYELFALDRQCYVLPDAQPSVDSFSFVEPGEVLDNVGGYSWTDHRLFIFEALPYLESSLVPSSVEKGRRGFGSMNLREHCNALGGLFHVMKEWRQNCKPLEASIEPRVRRVVESTVLDERDITEIERLLVGFYISTFTTIFCRASILPHRIVV